MKASNWKKWALVATVLVFAGCNPPDNGQTAQGTTTGTTTVTTTPGGTAPAANSEPVEVAFVTNNPSQYWTIAHKGCDKAVAETPGLKVDFEMPANGTTAEQTQIVNDMVSKGVKGIAISPENATDENDLIDGTVQKGVLVITQDSDAPKSQRACYIGTDNEAAGKQLGEEIKKALPQGGKLMAFVGAQDAQNAKDRLNGIKEALKGSNLDIMDVKTDGTDRARAKANVTDALTTHPELVGLIGLWSYNGPAIYSAVKDAGKIGKIQILCFDDEPDTINGIKAGAITATVVQHPYEFGRKGSEMMAQFIRGDKNTFPANKIIYIPTDVINKANVDKYVADQKQLLAG